MTGEEYLEIIHASLPATFSNSEADEYIAYVESAFLENYTNEKYQFSFLAFHLLYMCFIYKMIWQGNQFKVVGMEERVRQKCQPNPFDSPFRLSVVPEKEVIPFLNHYGFHQNKTKQFSSPVEWRDNCAHASGFIQYGNTDVNQNIQQVINYIDEIEKKNNQNITRIFIEYFTENFKPDDPGSYFPNGITSVEIFIKNYLLSFNDVLSILKAKVDILDLSSSNLYNLYLKVFYILLLGWYITNKNEVEFIDIDDAIDKLKLGLDEQEVISFEDLLTGDLFDISSLMNIEKDRQSTSCALAEEGAGGNQEKKEHPTTAST